jgi:hypothetical protein
MKKRNITQIMGWGAASIVITASVWVQQGPLVAILCVIGGVLLVPILSYLIKRKHRRDGSA